MTPPRGSPWASAPRGRSLQLHQLGLCTHPPPPISAAHPPAWGHPLGTRLGTGWQRQGPPKRQRIPRGPRPPSAISHESPSHDGDTAAGTRTPPRQEKAPVGGDQSILPGPARREPSPGLVTGTAPTHVTINIPHRHRSICMIRWGDDFSTDHWK